MDSSLHFFPDDLVDQLLSLHSALALEGLGHNSNGHVATIGVAADFVPLGHSYIVFQVSCYHDNATVWSV